jgi:hypothetical protein
VLDQNQPATMEDDSKLERRAWSRKEDDAILRLVQQVRPLALSFQSVPCVILCRIAGLTVAPLQYGTKSWTIIAQDLKKEVEGSCRTGKQCRTR